MKYNSCYYTLWKVRIYFYLNLSYSNLYQITDGHCAYDFRIKMAKYMRNDVKFLGT